MIRDVSGPMQGSVRLVQGEGLLSHGVQVSVRGNGAIMRVRGRRWCQLDGDVC